METSLYDDDDPKTLKRRLANRSLRASLFFRACMSDPDVKAPKFRSLRSSLFWQNTMLIFICMISVGRYYAYDNPQSLEGPIKDILQINDLYYSFFYSLYSIPNLVLPFMGGFLMDKYGVRIGIFSFATLVTIGTGIFWVSGIYEMYELMLLGRVIFGIGGELLEVAQNQLCFKWCPQNPGFGVGMMISFLRIGSAANVYFTPRIYNMTNSIDLPLFVGFTVCFGSWLFTILVVYIDYFNDKNERPRKYQEAEEKALDFGVFKRLDRVWWIYMAHGGLAYGILIGFLSISTDYMEQKFQLSNSKAGEIIALYFIISMMVTPFLGKLMDRLGRRLHVINVACVILVVTFSMLVMTPDCDTCYFPVYLFSSLGVFISLYGATYWACLPSLVSEENIGLACGLLFTSLNVGYMVCTIIIGSIKTALDYFWVIVALAGLCGVLLTMGLILEVLDVKTGVRLNQIPNFGESTHKPAEKKGENGKRAAQEIEGETSALKKSQNK